MPIITFSNGIERTIIGTLDVEKKVFSKKVRTSKHLYKKLDAWGIDAEYFNNVLLPGGYTLKITDIDDRIVYSLSAKDFEKHMHYLHFKRDGRDYGAQVFVPRIHWDKEACKSRVLSKEYRANYKKKAIPGVLPKL